MPSPHCHGLPVAQLVVKGQELQLNKARLLNRKIDRENLCSMERYVGKRAKLTLCIRNHIFYEREKKIM